MLHVLGVHKDKQQNLDGGLVLLKESGSAPLSHFHIIGCSWKVSDFLQLTGQILPICL